MITIDNEDDFLTHFSTLSDTIQALMMIAKKRQLAWKEHSDIDAWIAENALIKKFRISQRI